MPESIYITGHRNPDMDSVCSAYCYAELKNIIDPDTTYIPIRCGHMNNSTKEAFREIDTIPPKFLKDLRPRVLDIVKEPEERLHINDPVSAVVNLLNHKTISVVPVYDDDDRYAGLISVDEINGLFMRENSTGRPQYAFRAENFGHVVKGRLLKSGDQQEFTTFIMTGAMPYEVSLDRIRELLPNKPVMVVGMRTDLIAYAVREQFPAIIITGYKSYEQVDYDFSEYEGTVFVSYLDTAETIRLLRLSLPVKNILSRDIPKVQTQDLFDDALGILINSEFRGLPVFDGDAFIGTVTRRCFINRPRRRVILVDHNEASQSVRGLEDSQIVEIIDHHRLGAEKTRFPIYISAAPVGSTCTIVYQHFIRYHVEVRPQIAHLLLAGILSDTVILKSPTTTQEDQLVVEALCSILGISEYRSFGERLFSNTMVLTEADPRGLVEADFKIYHEFGCSFGIGQVEVNTLEDVDEVKDQFITTLETVKSTHHIDWAMLLITNVLKENSVLLSTSYPQAEKNLVYKQESAGKFALPGILSRKKQLLPEVLRVLEERS
jgi:manganese-dependent inorganic pyrophosphatase